MTVREMTVRESRDRRATRRRGRLQVVRTPAPASPDTASEPVEPAAGRTPAEPAPGQARAAPGAGRRWQVLLAVLVVLLVAALAAVVITGQRWYEHRKLDGAHQAALAAARQTTVDFVSISVSTIDRDLQRISAAATAEFKDEFTRGMPQVRAAVVENNVESRGTVLRAGLVSGDLDSAVVLVAVDATVKNARAPEGRLSHYRIQVELAIDRGSGRWLVSRLGFVG